MTLNKNIDNLLARYFGGSASDSDMLFLEKWIAESNENQIYFDQLTRLYEQINNNSAEIKNPDSNKAKKNFLQYISTKESQIPAYKMKHLPFYKNWMFRAAGITLFIILSFSGWMFFTSEHQIVFATQTNLKHRTLPDQTEIKLAKNSKLTYSSNYGKKERKIILQGEASFIAGHKGHGTLHIYADKTIIEDIGTVFSISSYPDSMNVSVKVKEGQVHFYTENNTGLVLKAHETGIYNKATEEFLKKIETDENTSEHIKHIRFNATQLSEVVKTLSKEYGVKIILDHQSLGKREITVSFDNEDVNVALQIIAKTLDLDVKKETGIYTLASAKSINKAIE